MSDVDPSRVELEQLTPRYFATSKQLSAPRAQRQVGLPVGAALGAVLGPAVGEREGAALGERVGEALGPAVGLLVGERLAEPAYVEVVRYAVCAMTTSLPEYTAFHCATAVAAAEAEPMASCTYHVMSTFRLCAAVGLPVGARVRAMVGARVGAFVGAACVVGAFVGAFVVAGYTLPTPGSSIELPLERTLVAEG